MSFTPALTTMPLPPASTPASPPHSPLMKIDLVMVTAAEAAGIEHADLAARSGLGDRAGEGLARRGAAARVDVVADAGDPGPGRLGGGGARAEHEPGGGAGKKGEITHRGL